MRYTRLCYCFHCGGGGQERGGGGGGRGGSEPIKRFDVGTCFDCLGARTGQRSIAAKETLTFDAMEHTLLGRLVCASAGAATARPFVRAASTDANRRRNESKSAPRSATRARLCSHSLCLSRPRRPSVLLPPGQSPTSTRPPTGKISKENKKDCRFLCACLGAVLKKRRKKKTREGRGARRFVLCLRFLFFWGQQTPPP